jgi:tRNA-splicing endonuclease subunit Sen15
VHPDDQVEELKSGADPTKGKPEREWVLPTHLAEKWSLRRFGEVFDAIEEEPLGEQSGKSEDEDVERKTMAEKRRGGKRLLLATLGDDSTVVYYVVHDGIVKPRQN